MKLKRKNTHLQLIFKCYIIPNQERSDIVENQVKIHNEVILVGRIICRQRNVQCNNKKAIKIGLAVPNDDNIEAGPNVAYVYVYDDGEIYNSLKRKQAIAINGHVECNWGQRIIADVISLIKESERAE